MSEYCGTTDNDVPRSTSGSHLITYQEWKSISSTRANQGVSPGRYYQVRLLNQRLPENGKTLTPKSSTAR